MDLRDFSQFWKSYIGTRPRSQEIIDAVNKGAKLPETYTYEDLAPGTKKLLTIKGVGWIPIEGWQRGEPFMMFALSFAENDIRLILNKTRGRDLVRITGEDTPEKWVGHRIAIYQGEAPKAGIRKAGSGKPTIRIESGR